MTFELDDLPAGFESNWDAVAEHLRTYWFKPTAATPRIGVARKAPDADERRKARYETAAWKAQHRVHARESARRRRAAKKASQRAVRP